MQITKNLDVIEKKRLQIRNQRKQIVLEATILAKKKKILSTSVIASIFLSENIQCNVYMKIHY